MHMEHGCYNINIIIICRYNYYFLWKVTYSVSYGDIFSSLIFIDNCFDMNCGSESEATIKCGGCGIALLAVSRTYSHFKPFPANIRTTSHFSQFGASRTILHNFKYKHQQSIEKLG